MAGSSHSPYYCGPPPVIAHASHTGDQEQTLYDLDTELTYRCEHGYVRDHNKVVSASWSQLREFIVKCSFISIRALLLEKFIHF